MPSALTLTLMKIAMTGATGFLGQHLVESLLTQGHTVRVLVRNKASAQERWGSRCELIHWPSTEQTIPTDAFDHTDAVIHLAGESVSGRWTSSKRRAIMRSRQGGTRRVVEALGKSQNGPKHLLSSSAIGYYGDRGITELDESSPMGDLFLSEVCHVWENEAMQAATDTTRVSLLRTGIVLHPEGGALKEMMPLFRKGLGGKLGAGRQMWSWIHLEDWIRAVVYILEATVEGPVNLTAPTPLPQSEFAKELAQILHRPAFLPAPAFALKAVLGGFASEVLTSKNVLPKKLLEAGFEFHFPRVNEALVDLVGS